MTTTNELSKHIGQTAMLTVDSLKFPVSVLDAKSVYGVDRFLVSPIGGSGQVWVNSSRVSVVTSQSEQEKKQ